MTETVEWMASEKALVQEFLKRFERYDAKGWTVYPETADWDLLLVGKETGCQLGIEAKLSLNAKVIDQALMGQHSRWSRYDGPDYRAVLVPAAKCQHHLKRICAAIGVGIIAISVEKYGIKHSLRLPSDIGFYEDWPNWGPNIRCPLPDYVPDVSAGVASPIKLTEWKVRAIKLSIVLDRKGWVDRGDMKALGISPSRWTDHYHGFLRQEQRGQYVRSSRTPDFRAQHPENYAQIEADATNWGKELDPFKQKAPDWLVAELVR